jgi:hypothetical protein
VGRDSASGRGLGYGARSIALGLTFVATSALAQDGGVVFLHGIPLDSRLPAGAKWSDARLLVKAAQAQPPLFVRRRPELVPDAGVLAIDLAAPLEVSDPPLPRHRASSWLVDYSEKAFTPVFADLKGTRVEDLVAFADHFIARKSMRRGFDLASQVARSHEGDCTEHAVFLAAVLRHAKYPARVMLGIVLLQMNGTPMAFGHAWTEVWRDAHWTVADAAIPPALGAVYLPTEEIVDEGPGFAVSLVPAVQALGTQGLRLEPRP